MLSRIGLGTAQFGSRYGVSNRRGRPSSREIAAILDLASAAGIDLLDTAAAYGPAEREIGRWRCVKDVNSFRIVTKTLPIDALVVEREHAVQITERFMRSLDFLCHSSLHGLLVHHGDLMLRPGAEHVADALRRLRAEGLVAKIGVSVYDAAELEAVFERFDFDLVQVPISVADQRLVNSGHLARLKRRGVEVHARSVFLQGLLLMTPKQLPDAFAATVAPLLARFVRACAELERSPLETCLEFVLGIPEVDCLLAGVNQAAELAQILAAAAADRPTAVDFAPLAFENSRLLNPVHWSLMS